MSLLILSGFEPNGFAGLLADDRLASSLGIPHAAIATGQTAQTQSSLVKAQAPAPALLSQQLACLTIIPTVVKIGVVFDHQSADIIAEWLSRLPVRPTVVLDPVNLNSGDQSAFSETPLAERLAPLLPWVNLLTPNVEECLTLTAQRDPAKAIQALKSSHDFNGALMLTGGHSIVRTDTAVIDILQPTENCAPWVLRQPRFNNNLRGSGCRLSTAIACALASGYNLTDACTLGSAVLHRHWRLAPDGSAYGWPDSIADYPEIAHAGTCPRAHRDFPALEWPAGLYPIVDSAAWIERLATTGVRTVQLRIKQASPEHLRSEIKQAVDIARQYKLQLFINDEWQLAIDYGAYGVHLGQEDLNEADLGAIAASGLRLGISTHGDAELMRALALKPSYIAVGAVFPTQTKDMSDQIQGIDRLRRYVRLCKGTPVVAIGGINHQNLTEVLNTDVPMVAVVSAVTQADQPETAAQTLNRHILNR